MLSVVERRLKKEIIIPTVSNSVDVSMYPLVVMLKQKNLPMRLRFVLRIYSLTSEKC